MAQLAAVVGVGQTKYKTKRADVSIAGLVREAAQNALNDAGLGWDDIDHKLSDTIAEYWVNFARNGNPNGPGLPEWPTYNSSADVVQIFDEDVRASVHPRKEQLDRMEKIFLGNR